MEQKEYWDEVSSTKEFTTPFHPQAFGRYVAKTARVLDVGCGYGRTLDELFRLGWRDLVGMDFSPGMIRRGSNQFPALELHVMQPGRIALPDSSVDAVILFAVLTCIRTNAEQQALIKEITRVLKPGGILYVNDFLLNTDPRNLARYQQFEEKYGVYGVFELPEGAVCRHHDQNWIRLLLGGLETLEYERLIFTTMNGNRSNGFYFIGRKASSSASVASAHTDGG